MQGQPFQGIWQILGYNSTGLPHKNTRDALAICPAPTRPESEASNNQPVYILFFTLLILTGAFMVKNEPVFRNQQFLANFLPLFFRQIRAWQAEIKNLRRQIETEEQTLRASCEAFITALALHFEQEKTVIQNTLKMDGKFSADRFNADCETIDKKKLKFLSKVETVPAMPTLRMVICFEHYETNHKIMTEHMKQLQKIQENLAASQHELNDLTTKLNEQRDLLDRQIQELNRTMTMNP